MSTPFTTVIRPIERLIEDNKDDTASRKLQSKCKTRSIRCSYLTDPRHIVYYEDQILLIKELPYVANPDLNFGSDN